MPLYKRTPNGCWWVRIGRKTRKSTGTTDRADAEEFERVLTERLWREQKLGDRSAVPWTEAAQRWLNDSAKPRKRDREFIAWLAPRVGQYAVSAVAHPDALEQLRKHGLREGWRHSTVDRMMGTVSAILHACVKWQYLSFTPAIPMYRAPKKEPRWLTQEEFKTLCDELPLHQQLAAKFAVASLLRMRAMLRLTWNRIDLKARRAWIPGAHQKAARTFGLALSPDAIRLLKDLRKLNPEGADVFQWNGEPLDDCNTAAFQKALQRAGIEGANWHSLRHTGAAWAVQSGVTLQELMTLGDWKDYRSVLIYAHLAPTQTVKAAERVGQMLHRALNPKKPSKIKSA